MFCPVQSKWMSFAIFHNQFSRILRPSMAFRGICFVSASVAAGKITSARCTLPNTARPLAAAASRMSARYSCLPSIAHSCARVGRSEANGHRRAATSRPTKHSQYPSSALLVGDESSRFRPAVKRSETYCIWCVILWKYTIKCNQIYILLLIECQLSLNIVEEFLYPNIVKANDKELYLLYCHIMKPSTCSNDHSRDNYEYLCSF